MITALCSGSSNLRRVLGEVVALWHAVLGTFLSKLAYVVSHFLLASQASSAGSPTYSCVFFFYSFPTWTWKCPVLVPTFTVSITWCLLFVIVTFYKSYWEYWLSEDSTIAPRGNTRLGSCKPLVLTFPSINEYVILLSVLLFKDALKAT